MRVPPCQVPVPGFYSTVLICKGNKSKSRDSAPQIIMLQYTFYCCGFNTNKIHCFLGIPKRLTSRAPSLFKVDFSVSLIWRLPLRTSLASLASYFVFRRMTVHLPTKDPQPDRVGGQMEKWKLTGGKAFSPSLCQSF